MPRAFIVMAMFAEEFMLGKKLLLLFACSFFLLTSFETEESIEEEPLYYILPYPFDGYKVYTDNREPWFFSLNNPIASSAKDVVPYHYFLDNFGEAFLDEDNYLPLTDLSTIDIVNDPRLSEACRMRLTKDCCQLSKNGFLYRYNGETKSYYYLPQEICTSYEIFDYFDKYSWDTHNLPEEILRILNLWYY